MSDYLHKGPLSNNRRIVSGAAAIVWALCIFIFSSVPGDSLPDFAQGFLTYVGHFCEYLILGLLVTAALASPQMPLWKAASIGLLIAAFYGATDEFHQLFVSGRTCDIFDWMTDVSGALVGAVVTIFIISRQKVTASRAKDATRK
jgi:VanZ family protein